MVTVAMVLIATVDWVYNYSVRLRREIKVLTRSEKCHSQEQNSAKLSRVLCLRFLECQGQDVESRHLFR